MQWYHLLRDTSTNFERAVVTIDTPCGHEYFLNPVFFERLPVLQWVVKYTACPFDSELHCLSFKMGPKVSGECGKQSLLAAVCVASIAMGKMEGDSNRE